MRKGFRSLLLSVAVLALALTAFATPRANAQASKIVMYGASSGDAETKSLQAIVKAWNDKNADMQVDLQFVPDYDVSLAKALGSNTPPDIFYVDSFRFLDLVNAGAIAAVGDKLTKVDDFIPALKNVFSTGGKFYCPPKDYSTLALQVNTEMLEKAGVKPPTTWAELLAAVKKLSTKDVPGLIVPTDPARWLAMLYQAGGSVTNDDYTKMTINSKEALEALKFYKDLYDAGARQAADVGAGWPGEALSKGKTAMTFEGNWIVGFMKDQAPNLKYQTVELPAGPKGKATMVFTVCYGVSAKSKNMDATVKFLDYLVGAEAMGKFTTDLGVLPSRMSLKDGWVKTYPNLSVYVDAASYAKRWGFVPGFNAVTDKIAEQIGMVFKGDQTPEDALKEIEKVGTEVLNKAQKK
jgi:multiple sugar transport system substrate-binding protein